MNSQVLCAQHSLDYSNMDPISGHSAESSLGHSIPLAPSKMASTEPPARRQSNPVEIEITQFDSRALLDPLENTGSPQPSKSSAPIPPRRDPTPSPLKRPTTPLRTPASKRLRRDLTKYPLEKKPFPPQTEKAITSFPRCSQCCRLNISRIFAGLPDDRSMKKPVRQLKREDRCPVCWVIYSFFMNDPEEEIAEFNLVVLSSSESHIGDLPLLAEIEHIIYKKVVYACRFLGLTDGCMFEIQPIFPAHMFDWVLATLQDSMIDIEAVRIWIDECSNSHETSCCVQEERGKEVIGMRLIDVNSRKIVQSAAGMSYAALSYVWGAAELPETGVFQHLPYPAPKTIEDSIELAKSLSIPYLWVDRYCISQLDNAEKHFQVSQMHRIYERARVTFIAAAGRDIHHGLPGVAGTPRQAQPHFTFDKRIFVALKPHPMVSIRDSTWYSRGWTYQEGLLSTRRLVFTDSQTYFECNHPAASEGIDEPIRRIARAAQQIGSGETCCGHAIDSVDIRLRPCTFHRGLAMPRQNRTDLEIWEHISNVSKRTLTFETEKINALKGIFGDFIDTGHLHGEICGIPSHLGRPANSGSQDKMSWTEGFLNGLLWNVRAPVSRWRKYPSWSWAGWKGNLDLYPSVGLTGRVDPSVRVWLETKDGRRLHGEEYQRLCDGLNGADFAGRMPYILLDVPVLTCKFDLQKSRSSSMTLWVLIDGLQTQVAFDSIVLNKRERITGWAGWSWDSLIEGGDGFQPQFDFDSFVSTKWISARKKFEVLTWDGLIFDQEGGDTKVLVVRDRGDYVERVGMFTLPQSFKKSLPPQTSINSLAERRIVRLG